MYVDWLNQCNNAFLSFASDTFVFFFWYVPTQACVEEYLFSLIALAGYRYIIWRYYGLLWRSTNYHHYHHLSTSLLAPIVSCNGIGNYIYLYFTEYNPKQGRRTSTMFKKRRQNNSSDEEQNENGITEQEVEVEEEIGIFYNYLKKDSNYNFKKKFCCCKFPKQTI